jgi:hypothetical protein
MSETYNPGDKIYPLDTFSDLIRNPGDWREPFYEVNQYGYIIDSSGYSWRARKEYFKLVAKLTRKGFR